MKATHRNRIPQALLIGSLTLASHGAELPVSQDGWIDFFDGDVKDGGTGDKLNVATPNPTGAFQYTRLAVFGFDTSGIDLASESRVAFSAVLSDDVIQNYAGTNLRFHLIDNSLLDEFDETTLTDGNAPGVAIGNLGSGNQQPPFSPRSSGPRAAPRPSRQKQIPSSLRAYSDHHDSVGIGQSSIRPSQSGIRGMALFAFGNCGKCSPVSIACQSDLLAVRGFNPLMCSALKNCPKTC